MCCFLPRPGRQQFGSPILRYPIFLEIRQDFEEDETKLKCENPERCVALCRFRDGNNFGSPNLRYLVFFYAQDF